MGLAAKAIANNLGFSAAVVKSTASQGISDDTLALFDFVNIMSYDYKGPWDMSPPLSDWSSYRNAEMELDYFIDSKGLPGSKVSLGVPFYGWNFCNTSHPTSFDWKDFVSEYPEQADVDEFEGKYYNGRKAIFDKSLLAKRRGASVMIWHVAADAPAGEYSLIRQIKNAYNSADSV